MKWIVFSDLHSTLDSYESAESSSKLLGRIREINSDGSLDFILFLGDFCNMGLGYEKAKSFLHKLRDILGESVRFYLCPGNHDIKRESTGNRYDTIMSARSNGNADFSIQFRDAYTNFEDMYLEVCDDERRYKPFEFYENENYCIIRVDTCLFSNDDDDEGNIFVLSPSLSKINPSPNKLNIVIMHHSCNFISAHERKRYAHWLADHNIDVVYCGHSHQTAFERIPETSRDGENLLQCTCGALHKEVNGNRKQQVTFLECSYSEINHRILTKIHFYSDSDNWSIDSTYRDNCEYNLKWKSNNDTYNAEEVSLPCSDMYTNIYQIDFKKELKNTTEFMYFGIKGDRVFTQFENTRDTLTENRQVSFRFLLTNPFSPFWIKRVPNLKEYDTPFKQEKHFADVYESQKNSYDCCLTASNAELRFHEEPIRYRLYIFDSKIFFSLYSHKHSLNAKIYVFNKDKDPTFYFTFRGLFEDYWEKYKNAQFFPETPKEYNHHRSVFPITPSLVINLTSSCQLSCRYCPKGGENLTEIKRLVDIDKIKLLMKEYLHNLRVHIKPLGKPVIRFTGGEPLMVADRLVELLNEIIRIDNDKLEHEKFEKIVLDTNGLELLDFYKKNTSLMCSLKEKLLIKISLDTLDYGTFKKIMKKNNGMTSKKFDNIKKAIDILSSNGFNIELNTVLQDINVDQIDDLYNYAKQKHLFGIKVLSINDFDGCVSYNCSLTSSVLAKFNNYLDSLSAQSNYTVSYPYLNIDSGIRMKRISDNNGCNLTFVNHEFDSAPRTFSNTCRKCDRFPNCSTGIMSIVLRADGKLSICRDCKFSHKRFDFSFNIYDSDLNDITHAVDSLMDNYLECFHYYVEVSNEKI